MCVWMYVCMYVCQFPLAAYYGKVVRARPVKFSHKIRPVQPFVVLKFRGCAINGVHVRVHLCRISAPAAGADESRAPSSDSSLSKLSGFNRAFNWIFYFFNRHLSALVAAAE